MNRSALGFVECACLAYDGKDDHRKVRKATHILEQMPGLASHSIYSATAAADVVQVRRLLKERPGAAVEPGGPRGWVPLLYLTYSRVPERLPERDAVEVTRLLLGAGADPDSAVILEGPVASPQSPAPSARAKTACSGSHRTLGHASLWSYCLTAARTPTTSRGSTTASSRPETSGWSYCSNEGSRQRTGLTGPIRECAPSTTSWDKR